MASGLGRNLTRQQSGGRKQAVSLLTCSWKPYNPSRPTSPTYVRFHRSDVLKWLSNYASHIIQNHLFITCTKKFVTFSYVWHQRQSGTYGICLGRDEAAGWPSCVTSTDTRLDCRAISSSVLSWPLSCIAVPSPNLHIWHRPAGFTRRHVLRWSSSARCSLRASLGATACGREGLLQQWAEGGQYSTGPWTAPGDLTCSRARVLPSWGGAAKASHYCISHRMWETVVTKGRWLSATQATPGETDRWQLGHRVLHWRGVWAACRPPEGPSQELPTVIYLQHTVRGACMTSLNLQMTKGRLSQPSSPPPLPIFDAWFLPWQKHCGLLNSRHIGSTGPGLRWGGGAVLLADREMNV